MGRGARGAAARAGRGGALARAGRGARAAGGGRAARGRRGAGGARRRGHAAARRRARAAAQAGVPFLLYHLSTAAHLRPRSYCTICHHCEFKIPSLALIIVAAHTVLIIHVNVVRARWECRGAYQRPLLGTALTLQVAHFALDLPHA